MLTGPRARVWGATIAGVWLAVVIGLDLVSPSRLVFVPFFPFAALIACAVLPARRTAVYAAFAALAALGAGWWDGTWTLAYRPLTDHTWRDLAYGQANAR